MISSTWHYRFVPEENNANDIFVIINYKKKTSTSTINVGTQSWLDLTLGSTTSKPTTGGSSRVEGTHVRLVFLSLSFSQILDGALCRAFKDNL